MQLCIIMRISSYHQYNVLEGSPPKKVQPFVSFRQHRPGGKPHATSKASQTQVCGVSSGSLMFLELPDPAA